MSKLFYIIGASGAGKDSLINHCREQINGALPIVFAHRYITRPANHSSENHISLTNEEFKLRLQHGMFALHWESHGLYYGIGIEINTWLQKGLTVVINGSREYLNRAIQQYPGLHPILITADAELIKTRLNSRGREDDNCITERLERNQQLNMADRVMMRIQNNSTVKDAANQLLDLILPSENFSSKN